MIGDVAGFVLVGLAILAVGVAVGVTILLVGLGPAYRPQAASWMCLCVTCGETFPSSDPAADDCGRHRNQATAAAAATPPRGPAPPPPS